MTRLAGRGCGFIAWLNPGERTAGTGIFFLPIRISENTKITERQ